MVARQARARERAMSPTTRIARGGCIEIYQEIAGGPRGCAAGIAVADAANGDGANARNC